MQLRINNNMVRNNVIHCFYNKFGGEEMKQKTIEVENQFFMIFFPIMVLLLLRISEWIFKETLGNLALYSVLAFSIFISLVNIRLKITEGK